MALTPQNQDAFFREVDDELRRDQAATFWRRHGRTVVIGVVLLLIVLAAAMLWQRSRAQAAARASEALTAGLDAISQRDAKGAAAALDPLASGGRKPYDALARLAFAAASAGRREPGAAAAFARVADDAAAPEPLRQAALIRRVSLDFDRMAPADVIAKLKPLAVPGGPWFGTAGELTALAELKLGRSAEAARLFAAVAHDDQAPESIRGRTVRMAASLGLEVAPPSGLIPKD